MQQTQQIARLAGPVLCAIGIGMLTNHAVYRELAEQFLAAYPFIYFSGILILLAGLLILNSHNVWTRDWRISVTLLGWVMCAIGAFRLIAPQFVVYVGGAIFSHGGFFIGAGAVFLALGGFLTFKGYTL
jgi:hypothetical protein